jgi:hypothetical protein
MDSALEIYDAEDKQIHEAEWQDIISQDEFDTSVFISQVIVTMREKVAKCASQEEATALLSKEWVEVQGGGNELEWTEDLKYAVIWTARNFEDLIDDYGNETAKWIVNDADDASYYEDAYEGNIEDCFDMLDSKMVIEYMKENYPDDEDEWEDDILSYIRNNYDDMYNACRAAAETGERWGAEKEMHEALDKACFGFAITDSDDDEILDGAWIDTKTKHDGKVKVYASFKNIVYLLSEEDFDLASGGFGFKIEVEQPYNGWSGWDKEGAKDEMKDSEFGRMVK